MSVVILFSIIVAVVFAAAFVSARRFGVLALGLAAGSVLSGLWSNWLAGRLEDFGLGLPWLATGVLATILLMLAPLVVLLMSGPRYHGKIERIVSALLIGLLMAAFLVAPLGKYMVLEGDARAVYLWLANIWQYVVTAGMIFGVIDLFLLHGQKSLGHRNKH